MEKQEWSHDGNFSESKYLGDYQSWIFKNVLFDFENRRKMLLLLKIK